MGVSVEVYRCRIGSFLCHGHQSSSMTSGVTDGRSFCFHLVPARTLILILLFIGGVELNPGPVYEHKCRFCSVVVHSAHKYYAHCLIHLSSMKKKNKFVPCSVPDCHAIISTPSSFQVHYSTYHTAARPAQPATPSTSSSTSSVAACPVEGCDEKLGSREFYMEHSREHLREGKRFVCIYDQCKTNLHNVKQFGTHMNRYHQDEEKKDFLSILKDSVLTSTSEQDVSTCGDMATDEMMDASVTEEDDAFIEEDDNAEEDIFPDSAIKDELATFYLRLEAVEVLPTSTVQIIAEEIKLITELIHRRIRKNLESELSNLKLKPDVINNVLFNTLNSETVYNIHHKSHDTIQLGTNHLRMKYWASRFNFIKPVEKFLGLSKSQRKRCAQRIPIKDSINLMLKDEKLKTVIVESLQHEHSFPDMNCPESVLQDFTDGTIFRDHVSCPEHAGKKCLQLLLFQDAFDPNAFGCGSYKPLGFYYTIGNIPSEIRNKLELIRLAYMVLENDLRNTDLEELEDEDKLKDALVPLMAELAELKKDGVIINGERVSVCLMFLIGDSLGQNHIGAYVRNFAAGYWCRFCSMSKAEFLQDPTETKPLRTPAQYDKFVRAAKKKWLTDRKEARANAKIRGDRAAARCTAPGNKRVMREAIAKSALEKLRGVHVRGVKYRPSPFNREDLNFHVVSHQPPCIAHDLFQGIIQYVLAAILKHLILDKKWFDLKTLNQRIRSFKAKGNDAADRPRPLKKLDKTYGNAVENWNLLRLLVFIIGDLIQDEEDPYWGMYLLLKELTEYVCAPKISMAQVAYLKTLIEEFISLVHRYLKSCLIPKLHFLCHYPELITLFGPLIRLFTLRFESKHAFFKDVIRSCKSYVNVTATMARKYMCRFAYDHNAQRCDVSYDAPCNVVYHNESEEIQMLLKDKQYFDIKTATIYGTDYYCGAYMILSSLDDAPGFKVGCIKRVMIDNNQKICLLFDERRAVKSLGYYTIDKSTDAYSIKRVEELPDYYPLQSYHFQGEECLSLKHSVCF